MKRNLILIFIIVCIGFVVMLPKNTLAATEGDYTYKVTDNKATITDYYYSPGVSGGVDTIPSTLGGYPVVAIGYRAFAGCKLNSITLPKGVTSIGPYAFENCSNITRITIPDSVTHIEIGAFYNCKNLRSITIPDSVISIGHSAFYGTEYYNNDSNWEDNILYIAKHLVKAKLTISGECEVKSDTKTIAGDAFNSCKYLTSIVIPENVTLIADGTFSYCDRLTSITIPDGVTSIGEYAFRECNSLTHLDIPNSVTFIDRCAFLGCNKLKSIIIPYGVSSIEEYTFQECSSLESIIIPESVNFIGGNAFSDCSKLANIIIPNGVTSINWGTFNGCTNLIKITIPSSVTSIEDDAFHNCTNISDVNFMGTIDMWNKIIIGFNNDNLTAATIHYIPYTKTSLLTSTPNYDIFTVVPLAGSIPSESSIIFACYNDNKLTHFEPQTYSGEENIYFVVYDTIKYDTIKVMVWENLSNLKPICQAEIVN